MPILSHTDIETLADAAIACGLAIPEKRLLLLQRLPTTLAGTLVRHISDADQVESDLLDLNQRAAVNGVPALLLWMRGAVRHTRHTHQHSIFETFETRLTALAPEPAAPQKKAVRLRPKPGQQVAAATAQRPALVHVPQGKFWMGSLDDDRDADDDEKPRHRVTVSHAFDLMATSVTQTQYYQVMGTVPSTFSGDHRPVERVSWLDAVLFANALSALEGRPNCYRIDGETVLWDRAASGYRLPTGAEWAYAASVGADEPRHGPLDAIAWYSDNSNGQTQPVGQKQANAWGLYDMLGNVWEWCWDYMGKFNRAPTVDPCGPSTGDHRVICGGSWLNNARNSRAASRAGALQGCRIGYLGFRLLRGQTKD